MLMTGKRRVLFVCIHNSARSQMAEAWLNHLAGDRFHAESAGIEPGNLNQVAVEVMREAGLDISRNTTKSVDAFIREGRRYDTVITVCDETAAERCPLFPGSGERLYWGFPDPSSFGGSYEEKLAKTREVRDAIRRTIEAWVQPLQL